jgi:hypothetical protein
MLSVQRLQFWVCMAGVRVSLQIIPYISSHISCGTIPAARAQVSASRLTTADERKLPLITLSFLCSASRVCCKCCAGEHVLRPVILSPSVTRHSWQYVYRIPHCR